MDDTIKRSDAIDAVIAYLDLCCMTEARFHKDGKSYNRQIAEELLEDVLTVEPKTGDIISREDAIKALDDGMNKWYSNVTLRQSMRDAINSIPSAEKQGEWIPCSERLPDLEEYVLVTLRYGETMIMALDWDDGKIEWKTQEESLIYDDDEVISWQPLPKPWKGADYE